MKCFKHFECHVKCPPPPCQPLTPCRGPRPGAEITSSKKMNRNLSGKLIIHFTLKGESNEAERKKTRAYCLLGSNSSCFKRFCLDCTLFVQLPLMLFKLLRYKAILDPIYYCNNNKQSKFVEMLQD